MLAVIFSLVSGSAPFHQLTIAYSADRRADVAPCHCDSAPLGGVDRQVGWIEKLRTDVPDVLVLDGGDNFFPDALQTEDSASSAKAELMADALARVKPLVTVPGERDFAAGLTMFKELGVRARMTWLVSNLSASAGKLPLTIPYHFVQVAGQRVLLIGLLTPSALPEELKKSGYKTEEPLAVAQRLVAQHKDSVDLIVIIAHTGGAIEESIAEKIDAPLLILSAHEGRLQFGGRGVGKSQIVSANHSGKYWVRLDLHYQTKQPLVAGLEVQKYMRQRVAYDKQAASQPASQPNRRTKLDADPLWTTQSTLFFQLIPMDREVPSVAELRARAKALDPTGYEIDDALNAAQMRGK